MTQRLFSGLVKISALVWLLLGLAITPRLWVDFMGSLGIISSLFLLCIVANGNGAVLFEALLALFEEGHPRLRLSRPGTPPGAE